MQMVETIKKKIEVAGVQPERVINSFFFYMGMAHKHESGLLITIRNISDEFSNADSPNDHLDILIKYLFRPNDSDVLRVRARGIFEMSLKDVLEGNL